MEGSLVEPAVHFCDQEPSLSCSQGSNSNAMSIVDNQLIVTWNAETVIVQGDYAITQTPENGDHDFSCITTYNTVTTNTATHESAVVSVRGACFFHACT